MPQTKTLSQTLEILSRHKIPVAKYKVLENKKDLRKISYPLYVKIDSQKHKSKLGGVKKCNTIHEASAAVKTFLKKFPKDLILLQEEIVGKEMFVGVKKDVVFGEVLVVGAGGTKVESKKDLRFRALPVKKSDIKKMIRELKIYPELKKENRHALNSLASLIKNIADFAQKTKPKELDLNPVILTKRDAVVVDARIF